MTDASPAAQPADPSPPPHPGPALGLLRRAEAAAFVAAALLSIVFYVRLPRTLPTEADWRAAAQDIASRAQPGDAVLLDPHWAERARLFVTAAPVLNLGRSPTREDLARYRRLFLLSLPELPRSDAEGARERLKALRFRSAGEPRAFGKVEVALLENEQPEIPTLDLTAAIARARVYLRRPDGSEELCPRRGDRHPCPRAGWIDVGAETKEIAFKPYRCLWAHPAGSEPLVVEYADLVMGDELRVLAGIVGQIAFRRDHYGPTTLEVKIDGEKVAEVTVEAGEPGERRRRIDTARWKGSAHKLQFEVSAPNPDMRHFCFDAGIY